MIEDRDRENVELSDQLTEAHRVIEQLRNDLAWEQATRRQLEGLAAPGPVSVMRPDGAAVEVVHGVGRDSQEIEPPLHYGHPDYGAWARLVTARIGELSVLELDYLLKDNAAHLDALETAVPGAGIALEDRIRMRMADLEAALVQP